MAGRPAKPTHLKLLHGDDKKNPDRINDTEPVPNEGEIIPPFQLSVAGREIWDRLAPDRIAKGVLTSWDTDAFAEFCEALVILRSKRRAANRKAEAGAPSPMTEYKGAISVVATLGGRFGWTPSDRTKLVVGEDRGGSDKEAFFSG